MSIVAREIHLKSRPHGLPTAADFTATQRALPQPGAGQLIVRNSFVSVDPYMRGRMIDEPSYIAPFELDAPLDGASIGTVVASGDERFPVGSTVTHFSGWRDYALIDAASANLVDTSRIPAETYLGPLGFPGLAAYAGLLQFGKPQAGETVFVSAASGAVGSVAVQIAKLKGARVVASVGSEAKANWLRELGADAVINYRETTDLASALRAAAPEGIDVYFDNVGGSHLEAAIEVANDFARIVLCGMIEQYNSEARGPRNIYTAVKKSIVLSGFITPNQLHLWSDFARDMATWIEAGQVKSRETIVDGLDNAVPAFLGLFSGNNVGKMLVRLPA
ncbi:NADP-dependent oxidoreductase [Devosia lacusdianchii]|jgi:NADPH-dependent curcumin reductase CurA|uniref:NADP-dependent oxidoreductase n=1 Tax=Devosia lacusdianchii TaxID=2917991 RepID=UPI001F06AEFE|nr:NADP-dependent oxidoreductase [Devosia sp. JXJ CY 41]